MLLQQQKARDDRWSFFKMMSPLPLDMASTPPLSFEAILHGVATLYLQSTGEKKQKQWTEGVQLVASEYNGKRW